MNDFEEAKKIKENIDYVRKLLAHVQELEQQKEIAVQNEDYDTAKILKYEIDKIRNSVG